MSNFRNLDVWKLGMDLVSIVYRCTRTYPDDERFGLVSQTQKCAVSVPANIAEGIGRRSNNDTRRFLYIARGSLYELETQLLVGEMNDYLHAEQLRELEKLIRECQAKLNALINYFQKVQFSDQSEKGHEP